MPKQIEWEIKLPAGERLHSSMGSVIHGAWMQKIPEKWAEILHQPGVRPYTEYLYWDRAREKAIWRFHFLDTEMQNALEPVLKSLSMLELSQRGYAIDLQRIAERSQSYEELADTVFTSAAAPKGTELKILTAASFKREGNYLQFPEIFLLLNSLLNRWNTFAGNINLKEDHLAAKLAAVCQIDRYALHSQNFSLEKQVIHGFAGSMHIKFWTGDAQRRLLGLLLSYADYAGIGIKTALGMGGTEGKLD